MKSTLLLAVLLLWPLVALGDEELDKALGLCQAEVQYFSLSTGKVTKVVFPNEYHLKDMPNSFFIDYRDDLKAGAYLTWGKIQPLEVRCHIQKGSLHVFYVKIDGKILDTVNSIYRQIEYLRSDTARLKPAVDEDWKSTTSQVRAEDQPPGPTQAPPFPVANIAYLKDGAFYIPAGQLNTYLGDFGDIDFYLARKDGTIAQWPNDIEKLSRDFILYRRLIVDFSKKGDKPSVAQTQGQFDATSQWLSDYHRHDVQAMLTYLHLSEQ